MQAIVHQHFPLLRLPLGVEVQLAGGRLWSMPFGEWYRLEERFKWRARRYDKVRPVFFSVSIEHTDAPGAEGSDRWKAAVNAQARVAVLRVYNALRLAFPLPLLSPGLSQGYLEGAGMIVVNQGLTDCETLVYERDASAYLALSARQIEVLKGFVTLLEAGSVATSAGWQLFEALEALARPEYEAIDEFVQSVLAIEGLLIPDVRHGVTEAFVQRCAALTVSDFNRIESARAFHAFVYALRSRILHGADPEPLCREATVDPRLIGVFARELLRRLLVRLVGFCRTETEHTKAALAFRQQAQAAASDPARHAALLERTATGVPVPEGLVLDEVLG